MQKKVALQICRDVVEKDVEVTVIPIPAATLILDLEERVRKLEEMMEGLEQK